MKQPQNTMIVYTEVSILPHHAGFGMWQRGELQLSHNDSWQYIEDLTRQFRQSCELLLPIDRALEDADFKAAGIEDIRGRIYNQPDYIYCMLRGGRVEYRGIVESEVDANFFDGI